MIAAHTGQSFSYRSTCRIASGLIHLQRRTCDLFRGQSERVQWLIIQKPQSLRFPWWIPDWENQVSPARYDKQNGIDLVVGRRHSKKKFDKLGVDRKKEVAEMIFREELKCLEILRDFFSNAKMAYFHYWGDYVMDTLHQPELAEINVELGKAIKPWEIENWETIVNLKDIPILYDDEGDLNIDIQTLHESGWIYNDLHPGAVYHTKVLNKVKGWLI
jgi:hypothetical protein